MSLSEPRTLADFIDQLQDRRLIDSVTWRSQRNDEMSGQGSGQVWTAEIAPPLWAADVALNTMRLADARRYRAILNSLSGPGQTFYLYDPIARYPASDPTGAILGASTVLINTIGADNKSVRLSGLPAGYKLATGDYFHVSYGSNPTRHALFEVSEQATASGAGLTGLFAVYPHIETGIAAGATAVLAKPAAKVMIVPGSIKPGTAQSLFVSGMSFSVIQKL